VTRQRIVLATRFCCFYLLAIGTSLLPLPAWAQDALPSPPTGTPAANSPERKGDRQAGPVQGAAENSTAVQSGTGLQSPVSSPGSTGTTPAQPNDPPRGPIAWEALSKPFCPCTPPFDEIPNPSGATLGFGWWGVMRSGNPWVIGQWQSTDSSPFWDTAGLWTNGTRTLNFSASGPDNEDTQAKIQYFGPNSQGFINFNRFIHAEEHENFNNMNASALVPGTGPGSGQPIIAQDLNPGTNYAIRVDQYEAQYKFNLVGQPGKEGPWLRSGVNIWDQEEEGDRQANNTVHCFTAQAASQQKSCHILSQAQGIDWNTFEVTPFFEGRFGKVNFQYSHTLRVFSTRDQPVIGQYTDGGANILEGDFPYSVVPENVFNMDKIKLGIDLNDHNRLYAFGYFSEVENSEAGVSREQGGVDLRWTNTAFKGLNLTTYFKNDDQSGNRPLALTSPDQTQGLTAAQQAAELFQLPNQIGFTQYTMGEKFSWRPWTGTCDSFLSRLSFTGGYEYYDLKRANENWYFPSLSATPPTFNISPTTPVFYQPNTTSNSFDFGVQVPWVEGFHTYVRYKLKFIKDDLLGYTPLNYGVNSSLPDTENIIEFGGEWFPSLNCGAAFNQSFNLSSRSGAPLPVAANPILVSTSPGDILNFGEDSYSTSVVLWYRPTDKMTLSVNSDYFANQIKQNITIGDDSSTSFTGSGANLVSFAPYTSPWTYGGTAVEFGGGLTYQFNPRLRFTADYEVTFGKDLITSGGVVVGSGTPVVNTFIPLGSYSAVRNVMQQVTAGFDYKPRKNLSMYLRYQLVDFNDRTDSSYSGSMNMVLGGMNLTW
jgi:hypothetical protein